MISNTSRILALADGLTASTEIAKIVGLSPRYVRKVLFRHLAPRLTVGAQQGSENHQFQTGRRVDLDGYVLVTAPQDHPHARQRAHRVGKLIFEHRLVMEHKLGRYLLPTEIVDHIDGLTLHNAPGNLRLFQSNGDHLAETTTGRTKLWSRAGHLNIGARTDRGREIEPVDSYGRRRKAGDVRLRQILLAALSLGADSPYLLGTNHHTTKAEIDLSSRSTTERALADLYERWA